MTTVPAIPTTAGPLAEEDYAALRRAGALRRPLRRAASVALSSAVTLAFFTFCSWVFVLIGAAAGSFSVAEIWVSVGLGVNTFFEFRGHRRLKRFYLFNFYPHLWR